MFHSKTFQTPSIKLFIIFIAAMMIASNLSAQSFVKITDTNNPIVTDALSGNYIGCSWIDIDNDRKLDLFVSRKAIYKNLGGGNFMKLETAMGNQTPNLGNSWSDYNNDGNIDCFVVATGASNSFLYKNDGSGIMNKIVSGEIGDSAFNTGWGCSWADYNNDGYTDLFITAANGFGVVNHSNRFYVNNTDGTFSRINFPGLTDTLGPFTIPTWSDYDQDGDVDLFIGTGPGGSASPDYIYKNTLVETGTANLVRLNLLPLTTDNHDGQNWNLIDYDNDGDLDAFITNYSSVPNILYRNNNGTYQRMTEAQVGTIVSDAGNYLANLWTDFDNDGDLDCFVTREIGQNARYYNNNGNGTFTRIDTTAVALTPGGNYGATAGDFDNNGSVDLYVAGTTGSKGLYRNDLTNGNKWVNIKCIGSGPAGGRSNKSALGTRVKAKATINGVAVWQIREINSQNSFNSMNMLNVHFGFGNAAVIDSLIIIWPRGLRETYSNITLNTFYNATEGEGIVSGISNISNTVPKQFKLNQNYPNPFNPSTNLEFGITNLGFVSLKIYDILGKEVATLVNGQLNPGTYKYNFDASGLTSGIYLYTLTTGSPREAGNYTETKTMTLLK